MQTITTQDAAAITAAAKNKATTAQKLREYIHSIKAQINGGEFDNHTNTTPKRSDAREKAAHDAATAAEKIVLNLTDADKMPTPHAGNATLKTVKISDLRARDNITRSSSNPYAARGESRVTRVIFWTNEDGTQSARVWETAYLGDYGFSHHYTDHAANDAVITYQFKAAAPAEAAEVARIIEKLNAMMPTKTDDPTAASRAQSAETDDRTAPAPATVARAERAQLHAAAAKLRRTEKFSAAHTDAGEWHKATAAQLFLIEIADDALTLSATNAKKIARESVSASTCQHFRATIPAAAFCEFLDAAPDALISIEYREGDKFPLTLRTNSTRLTLPSPAICEFTDATKPKNARIDAPREIADTPAQLETAARQRREQREASAANERKLDEQRAQAQAANQPTNEADATARKLQTAAKIARAQGKPALRLERAAKIAIIRQNRRFCDLFEFVNASAADFRAEAAQFRAENPKPPRDEKTGSPRARAQTKRTKKTAAPDAQKSFDFNPPEFTDAQRARSERQAKQWRREDEEEDFKQLPGESTREFYAARDAHLAEFETFGALFHNAPQPSAAHRIMTQHPRPTSATPQPARATAPNAHDEERAQEKREKRAREYEAAREQIRAVNAEQDARRAQTRADQQRQTISTESERQLSNTRQHPRQPSGAHASARDSPTTEHAEQLWELNNARRARVQAENRAPAVADAATAKLTQENERKAARRQQPHRADAQHRQPAAPAAATPMHRHRINPRERAGGRPPPPKRAQPLNDKVLSLRARIGKAAETRRAGRRPARARHKAIFGTDQSPRAPAIKRLQRNRGPPEKSAATSRQKSL